MRSEPPILRRLDAARDARTISAIDSSGRRFPIGKLDAHRQGLLHDAVSVFIFDGEDMLIQRRAAGKYHCAGLWANACCTHPDWGESAAASARRRLLEELGIDLPLTETGLTTYRADVGGGLIEHERVRVFQAHAGRETLRFDLNPAEVSEIAWMSRAELAAAAEAAPERFAPWLRIYLKRWDGLGLAA